MSQCGGKKGKKGGVVGGTLCGGCKKQGPITMRRCGGCHAVAYCSTACQKSHWKTGGHKKACLDAQARHKAESDSSAAVGGASQPPSADRDRSAPLAAAVAGVDEVAVTDACAEPKFPCPICKSNEEDFGECTMCTGCATQFCGDCCHPGGLNMYEVCPICNAPFSVPWRESVKRLEKLLKLKLEPRKRSLILSNLGAIHISGADGVPVCYPQGIKLLKRAIKEGGRASAFHNLGTLYHRGQGVQQDLQKAVELYTRAAELNFVEAQLTLARCYEDGIGVAKNIAEAKRWYEAAARDGHPDARQRLRHEDKPGGALWIQSQADLDADLQAAKEGDPDAQYRAAQHAQARGDTPAALEWTRLAAAQDQPDALALLAIHHAEHEGDPAEIVRLLEAAASMGNSRAQANLGCSYMLGRWVDKDYTKAFHWFGLAAEQGDDQSMLNIGYMLGKGYGTDVDPKEEAAWYLKAAKQGHPAAQCELAIMSAYGLGIPKNLKQAVRWMNLAVDQNDAKAQYYLGMWFVEGITVKEDYARGKRLLELAAAAGYEDAIQALKIPDEHLREAMTRRI